MTRHLLFGLGLVSLLAFTSHAEIEQECFVIDSSGTRATLGSLVNVSASGQSGSVNTSQGGLITHYGGFLGCVTLLPNLDTDSDGLADEIDPDNDNDGLTDLTEVGGNAFMPNTVTDINNADSDGDGASDGDEAMAMTMTNPQDVNALLQILDIARAGSITVEWFARDGKSYNLLAVDDLNAFGSAVVISNVTAVGGSAPWFETTATADDTNAPSNRSYFIQLAP
jgi:hypothetical protein